MRYYGLVPLSPISYRTVTGCCEGNARSISVLPNVDLRYSIICLDSDVDSDQDSAVAAGDLT